MTVGWAFIFILSMGILINMANCYVEHFVVFVRPKYIKSTYANVTVIINWIFVIAWVLFLLIYAIINFNTPLNIN